MPHKPPIINCHTHIFTGDHVPPFLAKTFIPFPLYYLLPVSGIVWFFRFWYKYPDRIRFMPWYKRVSEILYRVRVIGLRTGIGRVLGFLVGLFLAIQVFFIVHDWIIALGLPAGDMNGKIQVVRQKLIQYHLVWIPDAAVIRILMVLILFVFFKTGKNLILFLLKKVWSFLGVLPGPKTKELIIRYLNIGRFAFHEEQQTVWEKLKNQYLNGTGFVVLPMDMEYMEAGGLKKGSRYKDQMSALKELKLNNRYRDIIFPFVFVDPRRMIEEGDSHFAYSIQGGRVILEDCFIKEYIEGYGFSGFKIYPALGYYPFEEVMLPLWKYAADNAIPIMTHCIKGTIFYRGNKKKIWDQHPVFEQGSGNGQYKPLLLMETANIDFANNFTHPLNYLCLLDETLLRKLVGQAKDDRIRELFGFTNAETSMLYNLNHLKICFAHYGGDDEWSRFLEHDRDNYSSQLVRNPARGITFLTDEDDEIKKGKPEQIWKFVDWYSIISSLMLQYTEVYADLSYIIHNPDIQPLLKQTMQNEILKTKVLFGTDFYVVRNHKSEKSMLAETTYNLAEEELDQIGRINPRAFLKNSIHGAVVI